MGLRGSLSYSLLSSPQALALSKLRSYQIARHCPAPEYKGSGRCASVNQEGGRNKRGETNCQLDNCQTAL